MNRRKFLSLTAMAAPTVGLGLRSLLAQSSDVPRWRTYEITTSVNVLKPAGRTLVWLPQPLLQETTFQRTLSSAVHCDTGTTSFHDDHAAGMKMLIAEFPAGKPAVLTTTHRITTRDWSVPLQNPPASKKSAIPTDVAAFLHPTRYVPIDGIVKLKADEITKGATTDVEKTQNIYTWIVNNTYRDAKVRGCGVGDIRPMLETGDLGGKCADLNALFVGLVKAAGVPARDVYGIRIALTALECKSLGTSSSHIEKSQHCRAEVFLTGFGWVPMDPADVRKVILEEPPGNLDRSDPKVKSAEHRLFGSWEMNWMAYNYAQDVALPGSSGKPLHFFMYPQAETEEGRLDSLDPAVFRYEITSQELTSPQ
jgi:transglutaminase-like putative cysteine protease